MTLGNPAMRSGDFIREKLLNRGQPQPNTAPLMMGPPPGDGLIGGIVGRPDIGRVGPAPVDLAPRPTPPAPAPPAINPGLVSNIVNTGVTGGRTTPLPVLNNPDPISGTANRPMPTGGGYSPERKPKQKKNKAFTMPSQNKGMIF